MVVGGEKIKQGNCRTKTKIRCLHQQTDESSSTCWFLFLPFVVRCPSLKDSEKVDAHALQYFIDILIHRLSNRKKPHAKNFCWEAHLLLWLIAGRWVDQRFLVQFDLIECFLENFFAQQIIFFFTMHNRIARVFSFERMSQGWQTKLNFLCKRNGERNT